MTGIRNLAFALCGVVAVAAAPCARGAEVELRAVTALPSNLPTVQSFLKNFVTPVNESKNGHVKIKYLGGPEVTPPRTALAAMQRGVIDLLRSPASYYSGAVPEAFALIGSNLPVEELRRNGGMAALDEIWRKKAKAHLLAWADSGTHLYLYLSAKPAIKSNGPDLHGLKIRSTATYIGLLESLGAVPVSIGLSETQTAMERGVVSGFGTAAGSVLGMGVGKLVKTRIDPGFYRINVVAIVALDKWNALSKEARDVLTKAALEYEKTSVAAMRAEEEKEEETLKGYGMQVVKLEDSVAKAYLKTAYDSMWANLEKQAPDSAARLKPLFYK